MRTLSGAGNPEILRLVREASQYIGHAIADAVNLLNPSRVVVEGSLLETSDSVLASIKEAVYQRSSPLATRNLEIARSELGKDRGLLGGTQLGLERYFFNSPSLIK